MASRPMGGFPRTSMKHGPLLHSLFSIVDLHVRRIRWLQKLHNGERVQNAVLHIAAKGGRECTRPACHRGGARKDAAEVEICSVAAIKRGRRCNRARKNREKVNLEREKRRCESHYLGRLWKKTPTIRELISLKSLHRGSLSIPNHLSLLPPVCSARVEQSPTLKTTCTKLTCAGGCFVRIR